ncbi:MAG TPA: ubiquitin-like small modifier protein 1 [Vicinamibacterales bacterium]
MSLVFVIPGALRELAGGRDEIRVKGAATTIAAALSLLWAQCPGIRDRLITELGEVRPHVNIFVDGEDIRYAGGLDAPVHDGSEIFLLPAISGGSGPGARHARVRRTAPAGPDQLR